MTRHARPPGTTPVGRNRCGRRRDLGLRTARATATAWPARPSAGDRGARSLQDDVLEFRHAPPAPGAGARGAPAPSDRRCHAASSQARRLSATLVVAHDDPAARGTSAAREASPTTGRAPRVASVRDGRRETGVDINAPSAAQWCPTCTAGGWRRRGRRVPGSAVQGLRVGPGPPPDPIPTHGSHGEECPVRQHLEERTRRRRPAIRRCMFIHY